MDRIDKNISVSVMVSEIIVRCLKERHKKTIAEIAKLAGTTKKRISKIESGEDGFMLEHIIRMKEEIPIFVSLGEYLKESTIADYKKKGQEVPKDLLVMHEVFMQCLRPAAEIDKKTRKKKA